LVTLTCVCIPPWERWNEQILWYSFAKSKFSRESTVKKVVLLSILFLGSIAAISPAKTQEVIYYKASPKDIAFYHKDKNGTIFGCFKSLKKHLAKENKRLIFATNGGMYLKDLSPQGLYIENGKIIKQINRKNSTYGNFYMKPNGVFYITKDTKAHIVTTKDFKYSKSINFATQSGPMLVINGKIHHKFNKNSTSLYVRNGVGILPDGKLLFAISKDKINFYNFANFFKKMGCKNALYLDGFVSRIYSTELNITDQDFIFGIIIAKVGKVK
jgi:uncharacterized protein YigE (DUF2233 family)